MDDYDWTGRRLNARMGTLPNNSTGGDPLAGQPIAVRLGMIPPSGLGWQGQTSLNSGLLGNAPPPQMPPRNLLEYAEQKALSGTAPARSQSLIGSDYAQASAAKMTANFDAWNHKQLRQVLPVVDPLFDSAAGSLVPLIGTGEASGKPNAIGRREGDDLKTPLPVRDISQYTTRQNYDWQMTTPNKKRISDHKISTYPLGIFQAKAGTIYDHAGNADLWDQPFTEANQIRLGIQLMKDSGDLQGYFQNKISKADAMKKMGNIWEALPIDESGRNVSGKIANVDYNAWSGAMDEAKRIYNGE